MKYLLILSLLCLAFTCERVVPIKQHEANPVLSDTIKAVKAIPWQGVQDTIKPQSIVTNDCNAEHIVRGGRHWEPYSAKNYSPYWRPLDNSILGYMVDTFWVNATASIQLRVDSQITWLYPSPVRSAAVLPIPYTCWDQLIFGDSVISFPIMALQDPLNLDTARFSPMRVHVTERYTAPGRPVAAHGKAWRNDGIFDTLVIKYYPSQGQSITTKMIHP